MRVGAREINWESESERHTSIVGRGIELLLSLSKDTLVC